MFPLYDENLTRITPYVTYGLIGWAHIGCFVFGLILAPLFGLRRRDYTASE